MWRIAFFAWIALATLVACSTTVHVVVDERADFSRYHTWDWQPRNSSPIRAPYSDERAVRERLSGLIELALHARGFVRDQDRPDFLVDYALALERELVEVEINRGIREISTFTTEGTFQVQSSKIELRTYETGHLVLSLFPSTGGSRIWRSVLTRRVRDSFEPDLEIAVEKLIERLPTEMAGALTPRPPRTAPFREPIPVPHILSADTRSPQRSPDPPR